MITVYVEQRGAPALTPSLVFWPNLRFPLSPKRLFLREIMAQYREPFSVLARRVEEADFFAVPYEYFEVLHCAPEYLKGVYALAKSVRKKVLLFDYTDYVERKTELPEHAILFRVSVYRHHKKNNEIVMPYFVEDVGRAYGILPKEKGGTPSVGYCGQSSFSSVVRRCRATAKWCLSYFLLLLRFDTEPSVHRRGIFWRMSALKMLRRAGAITCDFIDRQFYSLHWKSGNFDPAVVRREYVENLRAADLALCVRGDANASQRFYEALSASRVPLFLDTDCVLPLEEVIDYDRIMLRVPWRELATLPERVRAWFETESAASFLERERRAREVYEKYLRLDRFFALVFDREKSPYTRLLFRSFTAP